MNKGKKHIKNHISNTWNTWVGFVKKEFYHVFRDRRTLLVMFGLPITLILIFGYALTNEVKNARVLIVNPDNDLHVQQLSEKLNAGSYFTITSIEPTTANMQSYFQDKTIQATVVFPNNFSTTWTKSNDVQIILDATDPNFAKTVVNYISTIITTFLMEKNRQTDIPLLITPEIKMLYNPSLNGSMTYVPGLIALVMMIVSTSLTAVSVVREKESGTMEVLLVSPIRPIWILLAKALTYFVLSLVDLVLILFMSNVVLDIPIRGSFLLLMAECILYILTCLALGLLISNTTSSQAVAMLMSMAAVLLPILVFTGFLFPLENMPLVFQWVANIFPAKWFNTIITGIMLKGIGLDKLWLETLILVVMVLILLFISLKNFKIQLE